MLSNEQLMTDLQADLSESRRQLREERVEKLRLRLALGNVARRLDMLHCSLDADDNEAAPQLGPIERLVRESLASSSGAAEAVRQAGRALEDVEWLRDDRGYLYCPWCGCFRDHGGHESTCLRQVALAALREAGLLPEEDKNNA